MRLKGKLLSALLLLFGVLVSGCSLVQSLASDTVVFAVIGDYGSGSQFEADVAGLVKRWRPDFIITTGDNNYPSGSQETIDAHIGQFYHEFIYPYEGSYGKGADQNRFFPTLGNHDWKAADLKPYLDYFTLPGNERYYDFIWGPVHFFALDSDPREPDGVEIDSSQADWLRERMAASSEPWKIVYMHHPPQASAIRGSANWMRWPYDEWGATAVLAGHEHVYERLVRKGVVYFVNGLGGDTIYEFDTKTRGGSLVRYNGDYGALRVEANPYKIKFQFYTRNRKLIDTYEIQH